MLELKGKVALITGGGSGIGEACAHSLSKQGAFVAVVDQHIEEAKRVVTELKNLGRQAIAISADVSDDSEVSRAVSETLREFGSLNIAVNNAGVGGDQAPTAEQSLAGWRKVISVNLDGVFYCMRHEIPAMIKSGGGSIINMASILGKVGYANASGYVAAKHGVVGLTKSAALEYATSGIRINSVGPGFIKTPLLSSVPKEALGSIAKLHALQRLGESHEVAALVTFLASNDSSFITGSYFAVDGGYLAQ